MLCYLEECVTINNVKNIKQKNGGRKQMTLQITNELIKTIKKNSYEKPDFIVEDIGTIDFKEKNGSLVIDRSYQRNFIQTDKNISKYVESVFLGLVIPEIQVYENYESGYREIIDGQQRVLSLLKFLRGECKLKGLTYLTVLNGMYFKDLPQELQTIYKQFGVNMRVAKNPNADYKYLLFERLNVGSKPLNQQEVRNSVFKDNEILKMTRKLSGNEDIVRMFGEIGSIKNDRFLRDELIINILSIVYGDMSLGRTLMKDRVNEYLMNTNNMTKLEVEEIFTEFLDITELLLKFDSSIFNVYAIKKSTLESIYVAMFNIKDRDKIKLNAKDVENAIVKALKSQEYFDSMSLGESQSNKEVLRRASIVLKEIKSVIG